jgi:hypothetical protein
MNIRAQQKVFEAFGLYDTRLAPFDRTLPLHQNGPVTAVDYRIVLNRLTGMRPLNYCRILPRFAVAKFGQTAGRRSVAGLAG